MALHGTAGPGQARRGEAGNQELPSCGKDLAAWRGVAGHGGAGLGTVWRGLARQGIKEGGGLWATTTPIRRISRHGRELSDEAAGCASSAASAPPSKAIIGRNTIPRRRT